MQGNNARCVGNFTVTYRLQGVFKGPDGDADIFSFLFQSMDATGPGAFATAQEQVDKFGAATRRRKVLRDRPECGECKASFLFGFAVCNLLRLLILVDQAGNHFDQPRVVGTAHGAYAKLLDQHHFIALRVVGQHTHGVTPVSLEELLERSDFITIHMPKTPETTGMIGAEQFKLMKPSAFIVNVARGGLIDEDALYEALTAGTIAGAGLDVFVNEPPVGSPLLGLPNIITTPHLGASTDEAQEKAGVSVAKSVRLALSGELVPDAVNVAGGVIDPYVRPGIPLLEKLGQVFSGLAGHSPLTSVDIEVRGELVEYDVSVLKLAALKGIFTNVVSETVSYVNAPLLAEQRGINVRLITDAESPEYRNVLTLRGALADGSQVSVSGTLIGTKQTEKIVEINGYEVEVPFAKHLIVMLYTDRPGIVAVYGREFGEAEINIAGMQIARHEAGGTALSVLTVDSPVPAGLLASVQDAISATVMVEIDLTD